MICVNIRGMFSPAKYWLRNKLRFLLWRNYREEAHKPTSKMPCRSWQPNLHTRRFEVCILATSVEGNKRMGDKLRPRTNLLMIPLVDQVQCNKNIRLTGTIFMGYLGVVNCMYCMRHKVNIQALRANGAALNATFDVNMKVHSGTD